MKKINTFIIATSIVALLSCSKTNVPSLEDDALHDDQTRSEATADAENENYGVTGIAVIPREEVEVKFMPKYPYILSVVNWDFDYAIAKLINE